MEEKKESFFARWSRLKKTTAELPANAPAGAPMAASTPSQAVELPSIESLTSESDYTGFFRAKVDEALRRAALKKMFQDPHFNVMDGLDVYIDDYSLPDPIPESMLAKLEHVKNILGRKDETEQQIAANEAKSITGDIESASLPGEAKHVEHAAAPDEQVKEQ